MRELFISDLSIERWMELQFDLNEMVDILEEQLGVLDFQNNEWKDIEIFRLSHYGNLKPLRRYINPFRIYITCEVSMYPVLAFATSDDLEIERIIYNAITEDPFEYLELWDEDYPHSRLNIDKIIDWESQEPCNYFYPVIELFWPIVWIFYRKKLHIQIPIRPHTMALFLSLYQDKNEVNFEWHRKRFFKKP